MNDSTSPSSHRDPRRRKSSGARKAIIAAVVVALAGGGWYGWKTYKDKANAEGEYVTAKIETGDIEDLVTSTGTLQPRDFVDVGAQVSGQIVKIFVEVGDMVQQGDVLAEIDAATAEAKVDQMRAQLLQAETNLEDSKNSLIKAQRDFDRQVNLLAADATTKEAKLNAETTLTSAKNRIKTQEASSDTPRSLRRRPER
jgi:macrolide-specific efflux system membrane fusion protein